MNGNCSVQASEKQLDGDHRTEVDLDTVLPLIEPHKVPRTYAPPEGARAVWRLRGWELELLPGGQNPGKWIFRWLCNNGIEPQSVMFDEDITVWRLPDGRQQIGYMCKDSRRRKDGSWRRVAAPKLVELKGQPPRLIRRRFRAFERVQATLKAGHQGQSLQHDPWGELGPYCPACSHERGVLVPFLCEPLKKLMPPWICEHWEKYIRERVADARAEGGAPISGS
jgi:hypothetical protein